MALYVSSHIVLPQQSTKLSRNSGSPDGTGLSEPSDSQDLA